MRLTITLLQRVTTLSLVAAALLWADFGLSNDMPWLALCGALVILFGYAFVLAGEFIAVYVVHGRSDDPTPRAGVLQLARAWWGEVLSSPRVFCWDQPFRSYLHPDQLPATPNGRRGVIFLHGYVCNRAFWNPWMAHLRTQEVPYIAVTLEPVFGSIGTYPQVIEDAVQRMEAATGLPPVIVGHSMGGLAIRAWLAATKGYARVHQVVTIGTPHHGTWLARFGHTTNACEMRLASDWLWQLKQHEPAGAFKRFTCFYGHCDNIVFPAATATLVGATNRHLDGVAHVHMGRDERVVQEVMSLVGVTAIRIGPTTESHR